jgi:UDP-N-acetylmuramoyl-tripeptide--D-alanyl-D-alanine ligase
VIALSLDEIAAITGGELHDLDPTDSTPAASATLITSATLVTGTVEFDSRRIGPGGLFVALAGEHVDGHGFAAAATHAGAVATLASRPVGTPAIVVENVLTALGTLARAVIGRLPDLTVIGITGSSGKTSTKDLLAQLMEPLGPTVAPPGSFNNELGHPYTVLRCDERTRFLVLEKSSRGIGHIRWLTQVAPPRIGVVLNVGAAHVGEFGSVEATAKAKGELVEALPPAADANGTASGGAGGVAVLNADDPAVAAMAGRTSARVVRYGMRQTADSATQPDVRATNVVLDPAGRASFTLHTPDGSADVTLGLHGEHHVANALACAAVATELGVDPDQIAQGLSRARPRSPGRMQVSVREDGVTVIDDSYNANPDSMRAGIRALAAMVCSGRRWAVLGYMAELGHAERAEHAAVGYAVAQLGIDELLVVGDVGEDIATEIHTAATARTGAWQGSSRLVPDADAALRTLRERLTPGDTVLVKASHSVGLDRVALGLLESDGLLKSDRLENRIMNKEGTA